MRRIATILTTLLLALSGAAATGCGTDDAIERDAKSAGKEADKAAGNTDEKAGQAAEDVVDEVDDDDSK